MTTTTVQGTKERIGSDTLTMSSTVHNSADEEASCRWKLFSARFDVSATRDSAKRHALSAHESTCGALHIGSARLFRVLLSIRKLSRSHPTNTRTATARRPSPPQIPPRCQKPKGSAPLALAIAPPTPNPLPNKPPRTRSSRWTRTSASIC